MIFPKIRNEIPNELGYLYRYNDKKYSNGVDEFDNPYPGYNIIVQLTKFPIIKITPKGAWISCWENASGQRFVLMGAIKKFACISEWEALKSFIARKEKQKRIYKEKIDQAERAIQIAKSSQRGLI